LSSALQGGTTDFYRSLNVPIAWKIVMVMWNCTLTSPGLSKNFSGCRRC